MKWTGVAVIAVCLATVGCSEDPARSVKVATSTFVPAKPVDRSSAESNQGMKPLDISRPTYPPPPRQMEYCPPPAEGAAGPGNLSAKGPCAFVQREAVSCESSKDDFIVAVARKAKLGATLVMYLNVEHYHGPGSYDKAELFVALQSGTVIHRWSGNDVHATVGPDEAFVELTNASLEAEPMLVDCSRSIGPDTNYQYQCEGRAASNVSIKNAPEILSGKLICAKKSDR